MKWSSRYLGVQRFSGAGPRGRGREWATLGVHPLSWLLSNTRLEEVCSTLTKGTFSSRLLLSNQDKGCTHSVAHSLPLPLDPALLNLSSVYYLRVMGFANIFLPADIRIEGKGIWVRCIGLLTFDIVYLEIQPQHTQYSECKKNSPKNERPWSHRTLLG